MPAILMIDIVTISVNIVAITFKNIRDYNLIKSVTKFPTLKCKNVLHILVRVSKPLVFYNNPLNAHIKYCTVKY